MLLTDYPKSEILEKAWNIFPENSLSDHPVSEKKFQDFAIRVEPNFGGSVFQNQYYKLLNCLNLTLNKVHFRLQNHFRDLMEDH